MKSHLQKKIRKHCFRFLVSDQNGAFAVIFALLLLPLLALAGAVVDYSQATSIKNQIQAAGDAAALAAGSATVENSDFDYIEEVANKVFAQNMINSGFAEIINIEVTQITDGVRVTADTTMPTSFLKLVGITNLDVGSFSEIAVSAAQIEIALVLDNTGSMGGSKLTALKNSAKLLVNTVMKNQTNENVKIALVPFAQYVNIGISNRNEPGIDVPADYSTPRPPYCRNTYPNSTRKCDRKKETYQCVVDGVTTTCTRWKYYNCTGSRGAPVWACTPRSPKNYRFYGCMGSRDNPWDTRDSSYNSRPALGLLNVWCGKPLTRLTKAKDEVIAGINAMSANGYTYIPSGLKWGWSLLSQEYPFNDALPYDADNKKVMILMTDGENTRSASYPKHDNSSTNEANSKTKQLCNNIKDEDIIVYTIAFEVTNTQIKNILQDCVGNGGEYFDATNATDLEAAFKSISKSLLDLRLTK